MLFLQQWKRKMKKLLFIFIIFLFLFIIPNVISFGISPPQINFLGNSGEKICQKIFLNPDGEGTFLGKTLWAKEDNLERKLSNHFLNPEDLGLKADFNKNFTIKNKSDVEICITGSKSGKYHGVLLYRLQNKPVQVGVWLSVLIKNSRENNFPLKLTGRIIEGKINNLNLGFFNIMGIFDFVLLLFLIFLLFILSKRKWRKKKNEFQNK